MGHYASEMGSTYHEERRKEQNEYRKVIAENIEKDIKKRGISVVLADILCDPSLYQVQHS